MRTEILFTPILAAAVLCSALSAQTAASVWDGVYTDAQTDRGKTLYKTECASCHTETLEGSGQIPPLAGPDFLKNWDGQTLADLFEKIQMTMPADAPGRLNHEQNADVLAFLLQFNKFPAGSSELKGDADSLRKIRFNYP